MAGKAEQKGELDWSRMTVEERGHALLEVYRQDKFADGDPFEFEGEPGVWRKLKITGLVKFAMDHTDLHEGPIGAVHRWMRDNELLYKQGVGAGTTYFILMEPSPIGSDPDGTAEEVEDALAAAMREITRLTTENDLLKEENDRLLAGRKPSGDASPSAYALELARQLKSLIVSE